MYQYSPIDQAIVDARVDEFRDQVKRYRAGELSDDEFLALRLRNGLYKQRVAYMLRVAIPYGMLESRQVRALAHIARTWDKGYGHITTRQNIQYNWPELDDVPDILAHLASVEMHAIQTSGNCVRNTTADHLAGITADEVADPRPWCEMIRQWSTLHPEFNYLPRKFKIAVTGADNDRAAVVFHDIGLKMKKNAAGELGFEVIAGGGLGRTPIIGPTIRDFLEPEHLLSYLDAILRVYNLEGDRKNKFKARIKILVRKLGAEAFAEKVEAEFAKIKGGPLTVTPEQIAKYEACFPAPAYVEGLPDEPPAAADAQLNGLSSKYEQWLAHNVLDHKVPGYRVVMVQLKEKGRPPGDITAEEMDQVADLADAFSFGEVRTTHEQNLVFGDVEARRLPALFAKLDALGLATPNTGLLTDMICCPGLDFCNLANASSIPLAKDITERMEGTEKLYKIGDVKVKMSGCVNACGHHHAGHIGILGVDKKGEEGYQILLGGSAENDASIGRWIGKAIDGEQVPQAIEDIGDVYLEQRHDQERFLDTVRRIGLKPFSERVYATIDQKTAAPAKEVS